MAIARVGSHRLAIDMDLHPIAVVLDLVQPSVSGGWSINQLGMHCLDELEGCGNLDVDSESRRTDRLLRGLGLRPPWGTRVHTGQLNSARPTQFGSGLHWIKQCKPMMGSSYVAP